ncbi:dihydrofolate reductase family protein [Streptomyces sp. NPDC017179]|uniref:dihydrofolate reductase family protein n=1 Tax=Streptomyces sp. NPDC017179 TaxID=3364979 RepID=UPI003792B897
MDERGVQAGHRRELRDVRGPSVRRLVFYIATTLDGFTPGRTAPIAPARAALSVTAEGTRFDTVLQGRRSYQIGLAAGITDAYPHLRHLVFSRTLSESPDPAVELMADDPENDPLVRGHVHGR